MIPDDTESYGLLARKFDLTRDIERQVRERLDATGGLIRLPSQKEPLASRARFIEALESIVKKEPPREHLLVLSYGKGLPPHLVHHLAAYLVERGELVDASGHPVSGLTAADKGHCTRPEFERALDRLCERNVNFKADWANAVELAKQQARLEGSCRGRRR